MELLQGALILLVALAIGWRPDASAAAIVVAPLLILLGTAAFSGLGLLMAGTLRAEATLAGANLVYVVMLGVGGVIFPLTKFPAGARPVLELLPTGALSTGLRSVLQQGTVFPAGNVATLVVWAVVAIALAARTFKWDWGKVQGGESRPGGAGSGTVLPAVMILTGIVSVQFGAGLAARLFGQIPPAAVTGLRLWTSAVAMVAISGRGFTRSVRDLKKRRAFGDAAIAISFGISLGVMNFSIYQSFARIPLGVAVTIEFLGPLAVAVAGSRHLRDVGWVALAATGVVLLTQGGHSHLDLAGVLFAGLAAACWAAYIVLSSATGRRFPGSAGLAIAMVVSAVIVTPPALIAGGGAMFRPAVLAIGTAIGILSSVIPYRLELESLRRMPMRLFGVWMSMEAGGGGADRAAPARPAPERRRVAGHLLRDGCLRRGRAVLARGRPPGTPDLGGAARPPKPPGPPAAWGALR